MRKLCTSADTKEVSLTIYNGGFGAVKEVRKVCLTGEETELVFADVAQHIETDSLLVEGLNVLEFNYDYDLVSRDKLLQKYVDKEVWLVKRESGEKRKCRLLSVEEGGRCVLEDYATKEIYIDSQAEIVLPSLPSGLIVKPALVWKIAPSKTDTVRVSYLSRGFKWIANYVVELSENVLNIAGWAEIKNESGATFENAKVKLIAGDVNRVNKGGRFRYFDGEVCVNEATKCYAEEKSFFDYHMYTLLHPTTLKNNQTKQINILSGSNVPYKKYYQLNMYEEKVNIVVEFANTKESGLGVPVPKGKVKLYKMNEDDGSLEFIGEDFIDHTPKDESIKLRIGNAFNITFDCIEVERKKVNGFEHHRYEYTIKNHKGEPAEVHFEHEIRGVWEMVSSSHDYVKKSSDKIEFVVSVPADDEIKVSFEYKVDRRIEVMLRK
ncbi:DUF4139 domain-containing protein [Caldicoprobacter algeriensis]|uniref:DUF4139 domain-containing protein n=1 Tax=Caldicoprobacter algeriensis TaxID=699281 RepID=UPI0020792C24|nr:DUF4139 domain-containing protein [Caldicoprobacter algeriensis]MCM8901556.1 DUF4139 domain-containing protein [Caldicoprobacter algeriensis]